LEENVAKTTTTKEIKKEWFLTFYCYHSTPKVVRTRPISIGRQQNVVNKQLIHQTL